MGRGLGQWEQWDGDPGEGHGQAVAGEQCRWMSRWGVFLHDLFISCGSISSAFRKLAGIRSKGSLLCVSRGNSGKSVPRFKHTLGLGVQPGILGKTGIRAQVPFGIICSGPACVSGCGQAAEGVARLPWVLVGAELLPGARKELPPRTFTIAWCLRLAAHPLIVFGLLPWAGSYFEGLSENSEKNK